MLINYAIYQYILTICYEGKFILTLIYKNVITANCY